MTLHPCPECRRAVSSAALQCPGCGHPLSGEGTVRARRGRDRMLPLVIGGAVLLSIPGNAALWMAAQRFGGAEESCVRVVRTHEVVSVTVPTPPLPPLPRLTVIEEPMRPVAPGYLPGMPRLENTAELARLTERLYPESLRGTGITATAIVQFRIRDDGTPDPETVEVRRATHDSFVDPAARVAERMRFRAEGDADPDGAWITLPITFHDR